MKEYKLNDRLSIPALGFGTWQITGKTCTEAVKTALEIGYRHIDTAESYGNQTKIMKALKESTVKREEIFLTSKLWKTHLHKNEAYESGKRILDELGVDYLDLFLIHWPIRSVPIMETLESLFELKSNGYIKEWGVSNFTIHHLEDIIARGVEIPLNQVEFHPSLNQKELKDFCDQHNIQLTAYSPIAQGADLKLPEIQKIAKAHNRSESQVILNWLIQKGLVAIPKATSREHIEDNFKCTEWELTKEEFNEVDNLNTNNRMIIASWSDFDY